MKKMLSTLSMFSRLAALAVSAAALVSLALVILGCPGVTDPGPGGALTADITPLTTTANTQGVSFDSAGWSGEGTANEFWTFRVSEYKAATVYFMAEKTAAQTVSVNVPQGADFTVTQGNADGETAGDERAVFTVNLKTAYDLLFERGSRTFTLNVAEEGKSSKTVNVKIAVGTAADLTGVAVYRVTRAAGEEDIVTYANPQHDTVRLNNEARGFMSDAAAATIRNRAEAWARGGTLTRMADIRHWQMPASSTEGGTWQAGSAADCLLDALAWVDQNARVAGDDGEFLIRVEKDEPLPIMNISLEGASRVTLRLRGYGQERVVTYNAVVMADGNARLMNMYVNNQSGVWETNYAGINTGLKQTQYFFNWTSGWGNGPAVAPAAAPYIGNRLHLERNITFDGLGAARSASTMTYGYLISMDCNSRLVMLEGSKITNYYTDNDMPSDRVVRFMGGNSSSDAVEYRNSNGSFYWYGGAITGNSTIGSMTHTNVGGLRYYTPLSFTGKNTAGQFRADRLIQSVYFKYGGEYRNNTTGGQSPSGSPIDYQLFGTGSTAVVAEPIDGEIYDGFPVFD